VVSIGREGPPLESRPADGARGWAELLAELLGGMAHTLNNRAATVRAVHALLSADGAGPAHRLLEQEAGQLEEVVTLLRLAGGRARALPEPFVPADVLRDAELLYHQHDLLRDVPLSVGAAATGAVLGHPGPAVHAVLVLLDAAGRHALRHGGTVRLGARDAGDAVELVVSTAVAGDAEPGAATVAAAAPVAAAAGASVFARREGNEVQLVLALPTLRAARAAEAGA
jgi:hypothetical protein